MMTAYATDTAIEAMKKGAFDYIQKPFKVDEIQVVIEKALVNVASRRKPQAARRITGYSFHNIIGRSDQCRPSSTSFNVWWTPGRASSPPVERGQEPHREGHHHNHAAKTRR